MSTDIWGQDILLEPSGQAGIGLTGELDLTHEVETGLQDIRLRLFTRVGSLFYDRAFGSYVPDWIKEEYTPHNALAFETEVRKRVTMEPRVESGSVKCKAKGCKDGTMEAVVYFRFLNDRTVYNLVLGYDPVTKEMVLRDGKTTA